MKGLVLDAMEGGALGMSTNRNDRHMREDGKPVSSRLADDDEFFALCDVLGERNAGVIETILGRNKVEHFEWYHELAQAYPAADSVAEPATSLVRAQSVARAARSRRADFQSRLPGYGLSHTVPLVRHFTLKDCQIFDEFPTWKNLMFLPVEVRKQAFADAERGKVAGRDR